MAHVVVDLKDQRPIWRQPDWFTREIREALPPEVTLAAPDTPSEGTGDGATRAHPDVLAAVADARVYMGFGIAEDVVKGAPHLEWAHTGSAGVASSLSPALLERGIVLTNSAGIHGPPMAEAAIGMMLYFFRGFDLAMPGKAARVWNTDPFYAADSPLREVVGSTVGIVGLGGIGREVAARAVALGARVLGLKRQERGAVPEGVEPLYGGRGLERLLGESDAVMITAPETNETHGLMDAAAFARMKAGAVLINVARGKIVVETALVAALQSGHLRGAGLDVFAREPLSPNSPLWEMPNVLVTPHVSPVSRGFWRREADLILHNIRCWLDGRMDDLRNVVDTEAGY